jgi:paraquat-inducible protein A
LDVPALMSLAGVLIALGLTQPALETRTFIFWRNEYSLLGNVLELRRDGRTAQWIALATCSIVYPAGKLLLLVYFWLMPSPRAWRSRSIRILRLLGRWSMLDVITIAAVLVAGYAVGPIDARPRVGLYFFAGGILSMMWVTLTMDHLARKTR